ncbi:glycosyltransferase [Psychroserpens sp. SPM9]|uniref:glycosyltransferase family 2 protein n=1 Tax=Psychroserpens sp. SPM9 TaxID=2975598 RepID=UPI0021A963E3|nr:glycosyltransferase [Psychroserpens sp. SPM9]MDG5490335.1 glycosyltransferase [Psychroserpens sp. SPM9]
MLLIIFIITVLYLLLIASLIYGFDKVSSFKIDDVVPQTKFSIVIPFRNEAENIPALLDAISQLQYPKSMYEILFVDDASTDDSVEQINSKMKAFKSVQFSMLKNNRTSPSPKKDAVTTAIKQAKHQWIVTTDADCSVPKYWLDGFDNYIQKNNPNMIVAPVSFEAVGSFFERFQLLDILSLQGATIGGFGIKKPFLCNGANLAYRKDFFEHNKGFEGNTHIASGDDVFLLEKALKADKKSVQYIKNEQVIVHTKAQISFANLKSQRVRWAAKTSHYKNAFGKLTGLLVLAMNGLLVCLPLLFVLKMISLKVLIYVIFIKFLIDFLLLFKTARFFNQEPYLSSFIFSSLFYPFFSVYIALISMFTSYKWKGRTHRR